MVTHLLNDLSFPIRLASIIQNEKLMNNSPFQIDKTAHYIDDYVTFFFTVIETCGGTFSECFPFPIRLIHSFQNGKLRNNAPFQSYKTTHYEPVYVAFFNIVIETCGGVFF
jgi:hypothetical protein